MRLDKDQKLPQKYAHKLLLQLFSVDELASGTYKKLGHTSRSQLDPEREGILDGKSDHLSITLLANVNLNLFRVPEEKI